MAQGDEHARNMLIEHNLRLVAHIVKKFENTGKMLKTSSPSGRSDSLKPSKAIPLEKEQSWQRMRRGVLKMKFSCTYARSKNKKDVSLHDPIGQDKEGNEISLIDVLKSENEDVIDTIQLNMELEKVKEYIDILDGREKEVIVGRFGLDLKKEKTQREIAKELGISRSYVSRIEKRALMKMFHEFYRAEKEKRKREKGK